MKDTSVSGLARAMPYLLRTALVLLMAAGGFMAIGLAAGCGDGETLRESTSPRAGASPARSIWAAAVPGVLLVSNDDGLTWQRRGGIPFYMSSLTRVSESEAWGAFRAEDDGVCWTTDGGRSWRAKSWPGVQPFSVQASEAYGVWACGGAGGETAEALSAGVIVTSADGGRTWRRRSPRGQPSFWRGVELPAGRALMVGGYSGTLCRGPLNSIDGWGHVRELTHEFFARDVVMANGQTGWTVGRARESDEGRIFTSRDGGASWQRQAANLRVAPLVAVCCTSKNDAWAVGERGTALTTSDGGATWRRVQLGTTADLNAVIFANPQTGWVVAGKQAAIYRTEDGGETWTSTTWDPQELRLTGAIALWP